MTQGWELEAREKSSANTLVVRPRFEGVGTARVEEDSFKDPTISDKLVWCEDLLELRWAAI